MVINIKNNTLFTDRVFEAIEAKAFEYKRTEKAIRDMAKEGKHSEYMENKLKDLLDDINRMELSLPGGDRGIFHEG
jgi:hypothetical protein